MDGTDSIRPDLPAGLPDYDPAASGGPRVRAIVPAPPEPEAEDASSSPRQVGSIGRLVTSQRDSATREALLTVGRALRRADRGKVASAINALLAGSSVAEVMATLEDLAGRP